MKNKLLLFFSALFIVTSISSQVNNYSKLIEEGTKLYREQQYKESFQKYKLALEIIDNEIDDIYNAACSAALSGNKTEAFSLLYKAIEKGFIDKEHLDKDCDLQSLRGSSEYGNLLVKISLKKQSVKSMDQVLDELFIKENTEESILHHFNENVTKRDTLMDMFFNTKRTNREKPMSKNEFLKTVSIVRNIVKDNGCLNFKEMPNENITVSHNYSIDKSGNNNTNFNKEVKYIITPNYFISNIADILIKPIGYSLNIAVNQDNKNSIKFNRMSLDSCYFSRTSKVSEEFSDFTSNIDTLKFRCGIIMHKKNVTALSFVLKNNKLNNYFEKLELKSIDCIKQSNDMTNICFISFYKKVNDSDKIQTFELIYNENLNLMLISNGSRYGYFQMKNFSKIKAFIKSEIKSIN